MNVKDDGRDKNKRNPLQSIDNRDCKRFHIKSIIGIWYYYYIFNKKYKTNLNILQRKK